MVFVLDLYIILCNNTEVWKSVLPMKMQWLISLMSNALWAV